MNPSRLTPLAIGATVALALSACGDDEPSVAASAATSAAEAGGGDVARYCDLTAELDDKGEAVFADLPQDAPADEVQRAEQQLLAEVSPSFDELIEVAPDAIADDVPILLDGIRARATTGEDPNQEASSAAEERILAFEEENCP
ncbi:hypothetical protein [Blastococcus haudaquaticus]|uniref:Uncharacterized protein n=1 Tax=Blastococcus haudaquaticus TaxID=1938745 RepID=A0A286H4Z8_9ACTN|nr:hypothetical protein [Blastococcus haudaquaticus]SOE02831.1 hypothetical protein SAMN06272739_3791 [Blastococcus haudaquaticus]